MKYYIDPMLMPMPHNSVIKKIKFYIGCAILFFGLVILIKDYLV
ncbi:hypothetical protein ACINWC743_2500 [Acinetobacter sp. WC-743]|nr:hypothetical protein ACINWC743_2500 [Acinetobacter sp. WC-743]